MGLPFTALLWGIHMQNVKVLRAVPTTIIVIRITTVIVILLPALTFPASVVLYTLADPLATLHRRTDVCPHMRGQHIWTHPHADVYS